MDAAVSTEVREVSLAEGYALIRELMPRHYEEVAKYKDLFLLDVDTRVYELFERAGGLIFLVPFHGGAVAGYCVGIVKHPPHYKGAKIYANDAVYVAPEFRGAGLFRKLRERTLEIAKARGACLATWHTKADTPMDQLMPRIGCQFFENIWTERL